MVIKAIQGISHTPWKIQTLVQDVSGYLKTMDQATISYIYREANMTADYLANMGHVTSAFKTWECPPTTDLRVIMYADMMGHTLVRRDVQSSLIIYPCKKEKQNKTKMEVHSGEMWGRYFKLPTCVC